MTQPIEIRIKRGTSSYLAEQNFVLDAGEPCLEIDTGKVKYGDGITPYNQLEYATGNDTSGTNNEIAGTDGFIGGGSDNSVTANYAGIVGGQTNVAEGVRSVVVGGSTNTASQQNAVVLGGSSNTAAGQNSAVVGGSGNLAEGVNSVAFGQDAVAKKFAQAVFSGGNFQAPGDAQFSIHHLRQSTDDSVPTRMYLNGVSGELVIPENTLWYFEVKVVAYDRTSDAGSVWSVRGGIRQDYSGAVQLIGSPMVESSGDEAWDASAKVEASADNTAKSLAVTVTGVGGHDIQWYATVFTSETTTEQPLASDMFVDILHPDPVTSLNVSVSGGGSAMYPTFSPTVYDYAVNSGTYFGDANARGYSVTINGGTPITGTATVNKCLRIKASGGSYFIRMTPNDLPVPTVSLKTAQYIPGYYLVVPNQGSPAYAIVYDGNGVPVFYTPGHGSIFSLAPGWESNRLTTNGLTGNYDRWDISVGYNSLTALPYNMINPDTRGGYHTWEIHESHSVRTPGRLGNIIYESYDSTGFYIQEQNPQNQIVWEWWSDDYFNTTYADFFHLNSIDVHPVTGDIVVSVRHPSAVFCIDYQTKNILWAIQGTVSYSSALQGSAKSNMTTNTKWLTLVGEPTVNGSTYAGPNAQHDARWVDHFIPPLTAGNSVVSISDNQSTTYKPARGVIFEINTNTNQAIFRSLVHSTIGNTPWQGSFNVVKELNGLTSHFCNFPTQHPNMVEYAGDASGVGSQTKTMEMDIAGDMYRVVKVRSDFFNLNYLRTTAGRSVTVQ